MKKIIALSVVFFSLQSFAQVIKPTPIPSSTTAPELHKDLVVFMKEQRMANAELKKELILANQKLELITASSPSKLITLRNGKKAQTTILAEGARIILDNGLEYFVGAFTYEGHGGESYEAANLCQKRGLAIASSERASVFMSYITWSDEQAIDWKALTNYDIVNQRGALYVQGSFYMYRSDLNTSWRTFSLCMR